MTWRKLFAPAALLASAVLGGCATTAVATDPVPADELRLGYSANITHGPALVGLENGFFEDALGDTTLTTQLFNAGPATIEAISAGAIDAAYIGPSPAINSFIRSGGQSAVVVAGATTGGAALVVDDGIDSSADLAGATLATPQLGNSQDVALRSWLADEGFRSTPEGGGDVLIAPTESSDTLALFQAEQIDGAWLPEPWVSRLVIEAGAHVLVNEADLWEDGVFPTTVLLVNRAFLAAHPQTVKALVDGHLEAVNWLTENPDEAAAVINARLEADTGTPLADEVIARALGSVAFSVDPAANTFVVLVEHAAAAGTGTNGDIDGLFDFRLLNELLGAASAEPVSAHGLGEE